MGHLKEGVMNEGPGPLWGECLNLRIPCSIRVGNYSKVEESYPSTLPCPTQPSHSRGTDMAK
jgi:hypothetical protein